MSPSLGQLESEQRDGRDRPDDGMRVVDVWESQEAYDSYAQEKIGPYSAEVGITDPPEMRVYQVHNYLGRGF